MALGELWYGVGRDAKYFIVINIGYGIGAGIIIEGKPLYGPFGMAGEFGHMTMDKDSKVRCACGNFGCLEALASGHAIADKAIQEIENGHPSSLINKVNGNLKQINSRMVADAARHGDQLSQKIFEQAVEYLGSAIASIINLISPQMVLIGGGVAQAEDLIFERIRKIARERTVQTRTRNVKIQPVTYGQNAATKGAVALILNEVLNLNVLDEALVQEASYSV
jgi:predicted NBD/HSP70 family sugar kinase